MKTTCLTLVWRIIVVLVAAGALCLLTPDRASSIDLSNCRRGLGMQSGAIPDHAIRASSSYDPASVGPSNARIRTERNGGAWCPKQQISKDVQEWIEVDLQEVKIITQVETQGRFGNGQGQEFVEVYSLDYQRIESGPWIKYRDRKSNDLFTGNSNTYIAELREINPPIIARAVRVVPQSSYPRTICLRLELYGCQWRGQLLSSCQIQLDGILSYSMPQGERRGTEVDLFDFTYDGRADDDYLSGGLGQLTDGAEGHTNFRLDPDNSGKKGYEWVGWKNDTVGRPPIEMLFEFDRLRNFSAVRFHCNNMFSKEVRVFRRAQFHFSSYSATVFQDQPVIYDYMRDTLIEFARNVIVPIPHRVGKFVQVELYFDAKWMMVSEVRFESDVVMGNYAGESSPVGQKMNVKVTVSPEELHTSSQGNQGNESSYLQSDSFRNSSTSSGTYPVALFDDQLVGIVLGLLGASILLLLAVVTSCIMCRCQHQKYGSAKRKIVGTQQVKLRFRDSLGSSHFSGTPSRKLSNGNTYSNIVTCDTDATTLDTLGTKILPVTNGCTYRQPSDYIQTRRLPEIPHIPIDTADFVSDMNPSTYTAFGIGCAGNSSVLISSQYVPLPMSFAPEDNQRFFMASTLTPHMAPYSGRETYLGQAFATCDARVCAQSILDWNDDLTVLEFPRESLSFREKLGEGMFGELHLCEVIFSPSDNPVHGSTKSRNRLVAVKVLSKTLLTRTRQDVYKEVQIMSHLRDPNILGLVGVCTKAEPFCIIVEYLQHGDLCQFLRCHAHSENFNSGCQESKTLSYGCLVYMATQVASGMKFLETHNVVHRDLATRNCLVGSQYTIKICDFGMSQSLYNADYYRVDGKAVLPIRWMAWESVLLGNFSTKSDVWSFGVTLWEILTLAREHPLSLLSDDEVIENCGRCYRGDTLRMTLAQPSNCPKELYDLMVECWNLNDSLRPSFLEIHMFLQRKNMGYRPVADYDQSIISETLLQNNLVDCSFS